MEMANLRTFEESLMTKSFVEFYETLACRGESSSHAYFQDRSFSTWENFIQEQKYNVLPIKSCVEENISAFPPHPYDEKTWKAKELLNDGELNDEFIVRSGTYTAVDGAAIGDISTFYNVSGFELHELPVKGTFVHPMIIPGFCYVIRPLDSQKPLFNGKALCLERIGMGYGKRLTFAGEKHGNENYFWSDTNPEGYGFSLEIVHVGDKFTILDHYNNPIGTVEVQTLRESQKETDLSVRSKNKLEKQSTVSLRCQIKYFDDSLFSHDVITVHGVAVSSKKKSRAQATVVEVKDCFINGQSVTLVPSTIKDIQKTKSLCAENTSDVNANCSIEGLHRNELPVVGTFVDPRITPGFKYKVRLLNSKKHLFEGEALTLLSIGRGYGKRITFAGKSLKENDNYFYSDTQPQGYGFTIEAVCEGNSFKVVDHNGCKIGQASVFKLCGPQVEVETEILNGVCIKKIEVSFACHILLDEESDGITTRVNGIAHVERKRGSSSVLRIAELEFVNLFNSQNCNLSSVNAFVKK